nr:GSCFA domain-containing protein [Celeribacter sp. PS-C1]
MPPQAFWKSGVVEADKRRWPEIYPPIFEIGPQTAVATAGSCFAQHIGRGLRGAGGNFLDVEPKPEGMSEEEAVRHGYGLYSARYGNIHTARQLRELLEDAFEIYVDERHFMTRDVAWFDALRPGVEPDGFATLDDATEARRAHLLKVVELALEMEVFVFTLGLTEGWIDRETGRVLAMAPGVIAGDFNPARYVFHNFTFDEVYADLVEIRRLLNGINPNVKLLLTVSSVRLVGTASGDMFWRRRPIRNPFYVLRRGTWRRHMRRWTTFPPMKLSPHGPRPRPPLPQTGARYGPKWWRGRWRCFCRHMGCGHLRVEALPV